MTKAIPAVLVLVFACLFVLSAALPPLLSQSMSAQTKPNIPRTLLGKPYRTRWDSQGRPPSRWTLAVTDHNGSDADPDPDLDNTLAHEAQIRSGDWTRAKMDTKPRAPIPLPLVLNTFPGSAPVRLRFMKFKRPMQYSPCSDGAPPPENAQFDEMDPRDEEEQHVQSPVVSRPEKKQGPCDVPVPVRRLKRLYDSGKWKSRLFEEY
ncbi:hypothetical protein J3R82DRAFT_5113 [Butyriboletus roseoflavus]|nr:hypothetical protein J3R82DRAFT_5113 [Butyriboletus roseoflavus]